MFHNTTAPMEPADPLAVVGAAAWVKDLSLALALGEVNPAGPAGAATAGHFEFTGQQEHDGERRQPGQK